MRKHSFALFAAVIFLFTVLSSCNDTEEIKDVFVDSYIHSIFDNSGIPVYTVMHTAYSFSKIGSVKVTGTTSPANQLIDFSGDGFSFYNKPDLTAYKPVVPAAETFTYNVVYDDGAVAAKTNAIVAKSVAPVQQLTAEKTSTDIKLSWKPAADAEAYKVRIFSTDLTSGKKGIIYESNFLVPKDNTTDLSIPFSLISLSPYLSTTLTFEVSAFIFEAGQDTYQSISVASVSGYYGV